jgi:hypothetical protein
VGADAKEPELVIEDPQVQLGNVVPCHWVLEQPPCKSDIKKLGGDRELHVCRFNPLFEVGDETLSLPSATRHRVRVSPRKVPQPLAEPVDLPLSLLAGNVEAIYELDLALVGRDPFGYVPIVLQVVSHAEEEVHVDLLVIVEDVLLDAENLLHGVVRAEELLLVGDGFKLSNPPDRHAQPDKCKDQDWYLKLDDRREEVLVEEAVNAPQISPLIVLIPDHSVGLAFHLGWLLSEDHLL